MNRFNFPPVGPERKPLLVDDATDNIPRLDPEYIAAAPQALQALLIASAEAEATMVRQSLIYRHTIEEIVRQGNMPQVAGRLRAWERRLPGAFFMIQQDGNHISVANIAGASTDLGGYKPAMYESLASKDSFPNKITDIHTDHVSSLLEIDTMTLVCETGAGLDTVRIRNLANNTRERGGYLVCHDTPPLLAKVGRERMPDVPYIALPPFKVFLGKALDQYHGRKVMTMKNTLTSMEPDEVDELLDLMKASKIEQLVVSQSVGPNMDIFLPRGQDILTKATQDLGLKTARERTIDRDSGSIVMVIVAERAKQIAYTALLEILFQNLADKAVKNGYYIKSKTASTAHTDLPENEAIAFMNGKGIDCKTSFNEGAFNEVSFTPTAILYTKNPNIPYGRLRIHTTQVHLTLSTKPSTTNALLVVGREGHGLFIPALHALREAVLPHLDSDSLIFDPHTDRDIEETATQIGLAIAFDLLGVTKKTEVIQQYCGTPFEREMYKTFGVSVDS